MAPCDHPLQSPINQNLIPTTVSYDESGFIHGTGGKIRAKIIEMFTHNAP
jgi:hypothetical protein